jgi:signal transduction histidine kinase
LDGGGNMLKNSKLKRWFNTIIFLGIGFIFYGFIFAPSVYGQEHREAVYISDYYKTTIEGSWKNIRSDKPEYKDNSYDDSAWQSVEAPFDNKEWSGYTGYVWYRKWIYLFSLQPDYNLGLELEKIADIDETFINGYLIGSSGSLTNQELTGDKVRIYRIPKNILNVGGYNLISIRARQINQSGPHFSGKVLVGNYDGFFTRLVQTEASMLFFSGLLVMLSLFNLLAFLRRPHAREYLFFSLGTFCMGIYAFCWTQWRYILGIESVWDFRFYYIAVILMIPSYVRFTYEIWRPKAGRSSSSVEKMFDYFSRGLVAYGILLVCFLFYLKDLSAWLTADAINDYVIVIASVISMIFLFYKIATGGKNVATIHFGLLAGLMGGILETIGPYFHFPRNIAVYGVAIFIICITLVLVKKYSRLNNEVKQYSLGLEKLVKLRTRQLQSREESRQQLLANISHDLRTPVSSVMGHVELLLDEIVDSPEEQKTYLKRIRTQMFGLNCLVQDLFELAKIKASRSSFKMVHMPVNGLVENIYEKYLFDVEHAGFQFERRVTVTSDIMVSVDENRMDQVFANLINNAVRHMQHGSTISIICKSGDSQAKAHDSMPGSQMVFLEVADDGIGIAPEDIPKIFERFYTVSKTREESSTGSGLGLAIAREIIEAHGGSIWIDEQVSHGCTVCFSLPVN